MIYSEVSQKDLKHFMYFKGHLFHIWSHKKLKVKEYECSSMFFYSKFGIQTFFHKIC